MDHIMLRAALMAALLAVCCAFSGSRIVEHSLDGLLEHPYQTSHEVGTDIVDPPRRTAGYFRLNRTEDAHMFFFFFESRADPSNDPIVLWMTGGPGCSSELAVFYENGPFHINDDLTLRESKHGWDVNHNMIFVDQPINTGFSYSKDPRDRIHDEEGVAQDMWEFLQEFFKLHPEYAGNDFFVTGESYAGHYVPAVSHRVWKGSKEGEGDVSIQFKGFGIGNGLTNPAIQYGAYADFALQNELISQQVRDRIQMGYPACKYGIDLCNSKGWSAECKIALNYCQSAIFEQIMLYCPGINVYDIRKKCIGKLCYDFSRLDRYINQESVRTKLGVGDRHWSSCDSQVYTDMQGDWMKNYAQLLPEMLADGVRVMIYAGDQDLICNWLGNRRWVDALKWEKADDWSRTQDATWVVDGADAGTVAAVGPLSFVKVFGAGHMVPMDQPANALHMITHFTRGQPLASGPGLRDAAIADDTDVIAAS